MLVKELAELFSVSPSYVRHLFKEWCRRNGKNPDDFKKLALVVENNEGDTDTIILDVANVDRLKDLKGWTIGGVVVVFDVPLEAAEWIRDYLSESWKKANRTLRKDRSFLRELNLEEYYGGVASGQGK